MMGLMNFKTIAAAALLSSALTAEVAVASTTLCPGTPETNDREFTVTVDPWAGPDPASTCLAYGSGNINGNTTAGSGEGLDPFLQSFTDYVVIDVSNKTNVGIPGYDGIIATTALTGSSGTIGLTYPSVPGYEYFDFAIGFKSGAGTIDPVWAVFGLAPGVSSLNWAISSQGLSNVILYEKYCVSEVPLPASLPLLLGGIGLLGFVGRRRKATTA
jgi:hypothetical protein